MTNTELSRKIGGNVKNRTASWEAEATVQRAVAESGFEPPGRSEYGIKRSESAPASNELKGNQGDNMEESHRKGSSDWMAFGLRVYPGFRTCR
jgi:hypothetical protein